MSVEWRNNLKKIGKLATIAFVARTLIGADLVNLPSPDSNCQMWTNWSVVCSEPKLRPDRYGAPICVENHTLSAAATEPTICLTYKVPPGLVAVVRSRSDGYSKYCSSFYQGNRQCLRRNGRKQCEIYAGTENKRMPPICINWLSNMPLSGMDPNVINHPWCKQWEKWNSICDRSKNGVISCRPAAKNPAANYADFSFYICTNWSVPNWCSEWTDGSQTWNRTGCETCKWDRGIPAGVKFVRCLKAIQGQHEVSNLRYAPP